MILCLFTLFLLWLSQQKILLIKLATFVSCAGGTGISRHQNHQTIRLSLLVQQVTVPGIELADIWQILHFMKRSHCGPARQSQPVYTAMRTHRAKHITLFNAFLLVKCIYVTTQLYSIIYTVNFYLLPSFSCICK